MKTPSSMNNKIKQLFPRDFQHTYFSSQTIYREDVERVADGVWLNDSLLNLYYLYLENIVQKEDCKMLFMAPSTSFWVQMCNSDHDVSEAVNELDLKNKQLIFIPVNDCSNVDCGGGSHWSLLVYHRRIKNTFYAYDSCNQYNLKSAKQLAHKLSRHITPGIKDAPVVESRPSPQQSNGYDCGCYVLAMTHYLAEHKGNDKDLCNKSSGVHDQVASNVRQTLLNILMEHE